MRSFFLDCFLILVCLMLSSVTRAFRSTSSLSFPRRLWAVRSMTTTDNNADTSIVDICQAKIQEALAAESVTVTGAYDDPNGSHISVTVVSEKFAGKRPVQRQQLVYKAIWEELQGPVHAVDSMICKTPSEA